MTPGPAMLAAVLPVVTKMPAPMMAPIPSDVRATGPRARRSRFSPFISSRSVSSDFLANSWRNMKAPLRAGPGPGHRGRSLHVAARGHPGRRDAVGADLAAQLLAQDAVA